MITWTGNSGVCGALKFEINDYMRGPFPIWLSLKASLLDCDVGGFKTFDEARTAAEKIANAVYKGIPVARMNRTREFKEITGQANSRYWQRGVWIPLEGE